MIEYARTDCYGHEPIYMDERAIGLGFRCLKCGLSLPTPRDADPYVHVERLRPSDVVDLIAANASYN